MQEDTLILDRLFSLIFTEKLLGSINQLRVKHKSSNTKLLMIFRFLY